MRNTSIIYPYIGEKTLLKRALPYIVLSALILFGFSAAGSGELYFIPGLILLALLIRWFGTEEYPPVLLLAFGYQWLQICLKPLYAVITFQKLESLTKFHDHIEEAYLLSVVGFAIMAFGVFSMLKKIKLDKNELNNYIEVLDTKKLMISYLVFSFVTAALASLRFAIPGLFQAFTALGYIKWALFFITFYTALKQDKYKLLLYAIIAFEFILGFASYFSNFKTILFMVLIGYFSLYKLKQRRVLLIGISIIGLGYLGVLWTAVKSDYRYFLNQDSGQQVVNVETSEALGYLVEKVGNINSNDLERGMEQLVDRISYIDFFSSCMAYIPKYMPYENVKLTKDAILHILLPRLFYPEKPPIDDSKHLTKYTGIDYADADDGTSIALGYFGDLYIDYGPVYMMIALFILGKLTGYIIRSVYRTAINTFWGMAIMPPIFLLVFEFENALIKLIGGLVVFWIVATIFNKFLVPRIDNYLKK